MASYKHYLHESMNPWYVAVDDKSIYVFNQSISIRHTIKICNGRPPSDDSCVLYPIM